MSVANGLKDQGFAFVYSVPARLCLYLSPEVLCMRFCCRLFGDHDQDVSIWVKTGCTLIEFCLCMTYLEAQKQSVMRQSLGPVLYLDVLFVFVPDSEMYFSTSLYPSLDKGTWLSELAWIPMRSHVKYNCMLKIQYMVCWFKNRLLEQEHLSSRKLALSIMQE